MQMATEVMAALAKKLGELQNELRELRGNMSDMEQRIAAVQWQADTASRALPATIYPEGVQRQWVAGDISRAGKVLYRATPAQRSRAATWVCIKGFEGDPD